MSSSKRPWFVVSKSALVGSGIRPLLGRITSEQEKTAREALEKAKNDRLKRKR